MHENQELEILLVEDNQEDAEIAIRALRKYNFADGIVHVGDGREALDFIFARGQFSGRDTNKKPKLILLDLKLPRVGGLETLKVLKSDPTTSSIPIVILTSSSEEKDLAESYRLGANSYLVKQVDYGKFCDSVRQIGCYWLVLNLLPYS
jgi:CheY-like chemotaxis protein